MKMKHFVWGLFLGLFAAVHSTPVNTVTQIPDNHGGDVYHEAERDGFLVDHFVLTSTTQSPTSTTQAPKTKASQAPQVILTFPQPSEELEGSGSWSNLMVEGSGETKSSGFGVDGSGQSTASDLIVLQTSSAESSKIATTVQASQRAFVNFMVEGSGETTSSGFGVDGSGESPITELSTSHSLTSTTESEPEEISTTTKASLVPPEETIRPSIIRQQRILNVEKSEPEIVGTPVKAQNLGEANPPTKGKTTPDWIIIVGFIVGLAALVAVCAAIATREKWNGPNQFSETKTNSSNQKMELEMQTFLHSDEPKENGKEAEYTVIPLDELPESYSSD